MSRVTPAQGRLPTRGPFHLQATVRVLQRRPVNRVDVWDGNRYLRVLPVENGHVLAAVTNRGTVARPDLYFAIRQFGELRGYLYFLGLGGSLVTDGPDRCG